MTATPDGRGYWLVASDGGIFAYGDAKFYGSTGGMHLTSPIVAMQRTATGHGYWMLRADGAGYDFTVDTVLTLDGKNPQVAARLLSALRSWRVLEPTRRARAPAALERIIRPRPASVSGA